MMKQRFSFGRSRPKLFSSGWPNPNIPMNIFRGPGTLWWAHMKVTGSLHRLFRRTEVVLRVCAGVGEPGSLSMVCSIERRLGQRQNTLKYIISPVALFCTHSYAPQPLTEAWNSYTKARRKFWLSISEVIQSVFLERASYFLRGDTGTIHENRFSIALRASFFSHHMVVNLFYITLTITALANFKIV